MFDGKEYFSRGHIFNICHPEPSIYPLLGSIYGMRNHWSRYHLIMSFMCNHGSLAEWTTVS